MMGRRAEIREIGWVLPSGVGAGAEILAHPEWLDWRAADNRALSEFSARDYLRSVKGYLDPSGACFLAAASLALGWKTRPQVPGIRDRVGLATVTLYGAPLSGYRFYEQLRQKGARLASPLLFPQSYANTPAALAAIEFGLGGPHMVFGGSAEVLDALDFALARLHDGTAEEMLVGAFEAVSAGPCPDGLEVLNGGLVLRLGLTPDAASPLRLAVTDDVLAGPPVRDRTEAGAVHAMLSFLQTLPPATVGV